MLNVCLLGATGSIGTQVLDIIRINKEFKLASFSFGKNIEQAIKIIDEFNPLLVCCSDLENKLYLENKYPTISFISGEEGLIEVANFCCDNPIVVNALVGTVGLKPTYKALENRRDVYLANKETLVIGGKLIMDVAKKNNCKIIPLDSEHSAIYQLLDDSDEKEIKNLILTASGGALRDYSRNSLESVTISDVLKHPTWKMGPKITVDCATMMNKGFEIIEAYYLFNVDIDNIKVLIHKTSTIHSMVEFNDHSICAQLASPDMRLPIHYALMGKKHTSCDIIKPLDFGQGLNLVLEPLDNNRYPLVNVARLALKKGGIYPCIMNAANEKAVELFLNGKIKFTDIEKIIITELNCEDYKKYNNNLTIDKILEIDKLVKGKVGNI